MITGAQLNIARKRLGLSLSTGAAAAGVSRRTFARWCASGVLSRTVERKVQRVMWGAARQHLFHDVCSACCGSGLVPKPGAPAVLPRIARPGSGGG
jgi:hypothetical protein